MMLNAAELELSLKGLPSKVLLRAGQPYPEDQDLNGGQLESEPPMSMMSAVPEVPDGEEWG